MIIKTETCFPSQNLIQNTSTCNPKTQHFIPTVLHPANHFDQVRDTTAVGYRWSLSAVTPTEWTCRPATVTLLHRRGYLTQKKFDIWFTYTLTATRAEYTIKKNLYYNFFSLQVEYITAPLIVYKISSHLWKRNNLKEKITLFSILSLNIVKAYLSKCTKNLHLNKLSYSSQLYWFLIRFKDTQ